MTGEDAAKPFLDKTDALAQALTGQIEQTRATIAGLTARLAELEEQAEAPRITRTTLTALADEADEPVTGQAEQDTVPAPELPEHPAYQQIMTVFADRGEPLRARDLCLAMDLPLLPRHTEGIRSKLKRLVSRGILVEAEPGLFAQPRP